MEKLKSDKNQVILGFAIIALLAVISILRVEADTNVACTSANTFGCLRDADVGRESEYVKMSNRAVNIPSSSSYYFPTAASGTPVFTPQQMILATNPTPTPGPWIGCAVRSFATNPGAVCVGREPFIDAGFCKNGFDLQPGETVRLPAVNGDCDWIRVNVAAPGTNIYRTLIVLE